MMLAHDRALGMPEDEPAAGVFLDREEIELGAELAMVALLRFLEHEQIRVELGLRRESRAVDALQHRVVLVAAPVRAGDAHQLERADLAGAVRVAAAAQIGEVADRVERDRFAFGDLARQFDFVRVAGESGRGLRRASTRRPVIS